MIEGLKLKVSCAELRKHCTERSKYHTNRANDKTKELPKLREIMESMTIAKPAPTLSHMNKSVSYQFDPKDAATELENDIRFHLNSSVVFEFFATHLFEDDYTLMEADLRRLEIIK